MPYYLNITEAFFLQFVFLKPGVDWRFVVVNWCSKQCCYLSFCLHLPVKGVVFAPIVPLSLGNLPQSGVWHDINHRREWWKRQLACLTCKCVLLLHPIGLSITTHTVVQVPFVFRLSSFGLSALCLIVCCWSVKHFRWKQLFIHTFGFLFMGFWNGFKLFKSIKGTLINQANRVLSAWLSV